jgi:hypothetical protein
MSSSFQGRGKNPGGGGGGGGGGGRGEEGVGGGARTENKLKAEGTLRYTTHSTPIILCSNFRTIYGGQERSRNRVVVPARQTT